MNRRPIDITMGMINVQVFQYSHLILILDSDLRDTVHLN